MSPRNVIWFCLFFCDVVELSWQTGDHTPKGVLSSFGSSKTWTKKTTPYTVTGCDCGCCGIVPQRLLYKHQMGPHFFTPAFRNLKTCSGNTVFKHVIGHTLENIHSNTNGLVVNKIQLKSFSYIYWIYYILQHLKQLRN